MRAGSSEKTSGLTLPEPFELNRTSIQDTICPSVFPAVEFDQFNLNNVSKKSAEKDLETYAIQEFIEKCCPCIPCGIEAFLFSNSLLKE